MPDQFFEQFEEIKSEIKEYMDFILYGVVNSIDEFI